MANKNIKDHASKGGRNRWLPKATHQGILKIMGKKLPCVVLEDGRRIITRTSVFKAFNRPQRGNKSTTEDTVKIPSFLDARNLRHLLTEEIQHLIAPVNYLDKNIDECVGYSAETIPIVCEIYLTARKSGILTPSQGVIADLSDVLIKSLSMVGIIGLVDEATGYQLIRPRDALESYLNKLLSKELASWCKRFPDEFYENIYKLKRWPEFSTSKNKYSCVGHYTNDIVYSRIGKDVLDELKERTPDTSRESMHQWLSVDTGHPILSQHIHSLIALQRLALSQGFGWLRFMDMINSVYPVKESVLEIKAI